MLLPWELVVLRCPMGCRLIGFCTMGADWREDRIGSALRGENPTVLRRLEAGFAVIGDTQFLPRLLPAPY